MPVLTLILAVVVIFVYVDYAKQSLKEDKKFLQERELIEEYKRCKNITESLLVGNERRVNYDY